MFFLAGCSESVSFKKGDIKDDFCGVGINFMYCKCAFHGDYCDSIGMKKGEAKKYVNEEYDKWIEDEREDFKQDCFLNNGIYKNNKCTYCDIGEVSRDGDCVAVDDDTLAEGDIDTDDEAENNEEGECKYDSDCDAICEGNIAWKMGCNPRTNACEKTFDTNCSDDVEVFSEMSFPKICHNGSCDRDLEAIEEKRALLQKEKDMWLEAGKMINSTRNDINVAMLDANKNCINGIADMTNLAIVEFATRVGSVLAGGIPDIAKMTQSAAEHSLELLNESIKNLSSAAVDYAGDAVNKLYAYSQGEPPEEEKKLKPHEYIKLNCDLYNYFIALNEESAEDLEKSIILAEKADAQLRALPN